MNKLLATAITGIEDERQKKYLQSLDWKIHVVQAGQDQPPNAFILPNGKIFIFSTILPICKNDDGLATVLAHELSHQIAHHSGEQISKNPIYIALGILLYSVTQTSWINDLLISGLLQLPASRAMESEADHIGCELLAKLCFNISEAVNFWNRMDQVEKTMQGAYDTTQVQEFFSTHPATKKRIADIQSWMPRLEQLKEGSGCYDYQFGHFRESTRNFFRR
jgi:Zn-dependent protease with chaperone function